MCCSVHCGNMSTTWQSSTDAATDAINIHIFHKSNSPFSDLGTTPGGGCHHPAIAPSMVPTSVIVGRNGGIAFQHWSNTPQNDSSCSDVKRMSGMGGAPRHGRTPRKMSSVTARSLRRCGYGRSLVATYDDDEQR